MTEEQMQAKLDELQGIIDTLKKNESNQNSYITKLEGEKNALASTLKEVKDTASNVKPTGFDPAVAKYLKDQYINDLTARAKQMIVDIHGQEKLDLLEKDLDKFLKQYMNDKNRSENYIVDSFNLIVGRAYAEKDHAIHKLNATEVEPTPTPQPDVPYVNRPATPPIITDNDTGAGGAPSPAPRIQAANTKEAMKSWKEKFLASLN